MKAKRAMILAAGMGTRLGPLTARRPKALVDVAGRTLLEIAIGRLREAGVREVIVNVHHFADMIVEFLEAGEFGVRIEVSREEVLLDTGGGLAQASGFFLGDPDRLDEPFILHNVDVVSEIDLEEMERFHLGRGAMATLAVQDRPTSRYLLFDHDIELCGWRSKVRAETRLVRPAPELVELAFAGIHMISPRLLPGITGEGAFSIIESYLKLAESGAKIVGFRADAYRWRDVGSPESLRAVREHLSR